MSNVAIVHDGFSTLKLVTKPIPKPFAEQVVVQVKLRTIHVADLGHNMANLVANETPGHEGYGIVHEVGKGVTKFHKGQRVVPMSKNKGTWQEYICLDEEWVWPLPDEITDEQAAQFLNPPWTAYSLLREFVDVPKGEYLIQSAAGSTLGRQAIALARHWGIKLINVVRRAEQKAELKALGADEVICSADEDVVARVKEVTAGKGAWGAMDAVAGDMTQTLGSCMRDGGLILVHGMLSGMVASVGVLDLLRGVQVHGYTTMKVIGVRESREACAAEVAALMKEGIIRIAEVEKFELKDFKQAIARAQKAPSTVKILLASA